MAVAYVQGMQGSDPHYFRVIATPKHFAVHSGPEPARHSINVVVSKHDEEDTYLPAFRAAIVEGYAGSVMCAYNRINGEPACANTFLLQDELREKWKFSGYVVSDCDSVADMQQGHHYTKTMEEAAAISMQRGTDLDCDIPGTDYSKYADAFKAGLLDSATLDRTVKRLMAARFALGLFDPPERVAYSAISASENDSAAHRQLALKADYYRAARDRERICGEGDNICAGYTVSAQRRRHTHEGAYGRRRQTGPTGGIFQGTRSRWSAGIAQTGCAGGF